MRPPVEIPQITRNIELGFLGYVAQVIDRAGGGWELIRDPHPVRAGASCVLRNRAGVELILEVEATWGEHAMLGRLEELSR